MHKCGPPLMVMTHAHLLLGRLTDLPFAPKLSAPTGAFSRLENCVGREWMIVAKGGQKAGAAFSGFPCFLVIDW